MEGGGDDASVNSLESAQKHEGARARSLQKSPGSGPGAGDLRKPIDEKGAAKLMEMDSQFGASVLNDEDP